MALLRHCLHQLRTRNLEHEPPAGRWMPARTEHGQGVAGPSMPLPGSRGHEALAPLTRRPPAA